MAELKKIAKLVGFGAKNPDGSRPFVTASMVVEKVAQLVAELAALKEQQQSSSDAISGKRKDAPETDAPSAPPAKKGCPPREPSRRVIQPDELTAERFARIDAFPRFPEHAHLEKLHVFRGDDGAEMVLVGFNQHRTAFSAMCVSKKALLNPTSDIDRILPIEVKHWKYGYRLEFVADQIGDMSAFKQERTQLQFWSRFGGAPRDLAVIFDGVWRHVRVVDYLPLNKKYKIVVKPVDEKGGVGTKTWRVRFDLRRFRELP